MTKQNAHSSHVEAKTEGGRCDSTIAEHPDGLDELFKLLASGQTPNFLQMMSAISGLVAFLSKDDTNKLPVVGDENFMSQNKCRFCD